MVWCSDQLEKKKEMILDQPKNAFTFLELLAK